MYQKNSDGDWLEFGDNAVKQGWATGVVHRLRETGRIKNPDAKSKLSHFFLMKKNELEQDESTVLPKLRSLDCYWIYNPDNRYTMIK